jgi:hypothetical protein
VQGDIDGGNGGGQSPAALEVLRPVCVPAQRGEGSAAS